MKYKTHLTTSLAVALPVLASTGNLTVGNVIAVSFGALLPDIDEQHSWIGRRTRGVSDLMNTVFGHRGITHSIWISACADSYFICSRNDTFIIYERYVHIGWLFSAFGGR